MKSPVSLLLIPIALLLLATSCGGGRSDMAVSEGEADSMRYAANLAIVRHDEQIAAAEIALGLFHAGVILVP